MCWWGNACLKNLIARPRTCWLDSSVQLLIANPADYSFPSGHTLSSVIGATGLTKTNRRFGYAAIPLAALIAFSRLYLYVYFPSDVLAAAAENCWSAGTRRAAGSVREAVKYKSVLNLTGSGRFF